MHWTLRAPELSATSRIVRICTIAKTPLRLPRRLGDDAADAPSFVFRERARFDDHHAIALPALAFLVMRHETPALFHALTINFVLDQTVHLDHHGLGHFGGDHRSLAPLNSFPHRWSLSPWPWFPFAESP